jgi:hypothetical protein
LSTAAPLVSGARMTEPRGVFALLLAIVGIVTVLPSVFLGPIALTLAVRARNRIEASEEVLNGEALAHAGFIMGVVATSMGTLIVLFLGFTAVVLIDSGGF